MVKKTDPMFFYCTQDDHCESGMVGVVNPSSDMTLDMYKKAASNTDNTVSPKSVSGGVIAKASSSVESASTMMSGSMDMSMSKPTESMMPSGTMASMSMSASDASKTMAPGSPTMKPTDGTNAAGHAKAAMGGVASLAMGVITLLVL